MTEKCLRRSVRIMVVNDFRIMEKDFDIQPWINLLCCCRMIISLHSELSTALYPMNITYVGFFNRISWKLTTIKDHILLHHVWLSLELFLLDDQPLCKSKITFRQKQTRTVEQYHILKLIWCKTTDFESFMIVMSFTYDWQFSLKQFNMLSLWSNK